MLVMIMALPPGPGVLPGLSQPVTSCADARAEQLRSSPLAERAPGAVFHLWACVENPGPSLTRIDLIEGRLLRATANPDDWQRVMVADGVSRTVQPGERFWVSLRGLCVQPELWSPWGQLMVPDGYMDSSAMQDYRAASPPAGWAMPAELLGLLANAYAGKPAPSHQLMEVP